MADTLVQFKINETSKLEAERICNNYGIDLESYLRMCIARLISNNGIPFDMVIDDKPSKWNKRPYGDAKNFRGKR